MSEPQAAPPVPAPPAGESRRERVGRLSHRTRLYLTAGVLVAALVLVVVLVVQNTRRVRVGWVFGHSDISLVYLILFATILGWVLGLATAVALRRRTHRRHA